MGATRNTGYLENLIQYDASDNVAIATSVNPSYKVTLGGNLLGTSATFSGIVEVGNTVGSAINSASGLGNLVVGNGGASSQGITIYTGASTYGGLNFADATTGGGAYAGYIKFDHSNNSMGFFIGNVSRLSLASTGAATFSSSSGIGMTIRADWDRSATNNSQLYIQGNSNTNKQLRIGYDTTGNVGYIQALTSGTSVDNLLINPSGGNVGIGNTSISNPISFIRVLNISGGDAGLVFSNTNGTAKNWSIGAIDSGSFVFFDGASERMRITSGGNVLIGTTSDQGRLTVANSACIVVVQSTTSTQFNGLEMKNGGGSFYFGQDNSSGTFYGSNAAYAGSLYMSGNYPMVFFTNQTERMRITSGGNVGIGSNNPLCLLQAGSIGNSTVRLGTSSTTNTSTSSAFAAWNSSGQDILTARGDGLVAFAKINDFTTGNSPNTWINPSPSYGIYINTSSIRYKRDIVDYDKGLSTVSQLRPVYYKGKSEVDGDKQFAGFIAEEIDALGLTEFVNYLEDGRPNSLSYPNMVALLTKAIQELNQKIEALENK